LDEPESFRHSLWIIESIRGNGYSPSDANCHIMLSQDRKTILIGSIITSKQHSGGAEAAPDLRNPVTFGCDVNRALHDSVTCSHDQFSAPGITHVVGS
jgi:hypothetical protein